VYLLYSDESGTPHDPKLKHFVLAGFCLFERQGFWLADELDKIAKRFDPGDPSSIELHGNPMFGGKGYWRKIPKSDRITAICDALKVFASSHQSNKLFSCIIEKGALSPRDPVALAFEQISTRFDYYLQRLHQQGNTQRGIIVFDKSVYESAIQSLAADFRTIGHKWGIIRNFAEVPLFIDSRASRLTQLADLIAYAVFRNYEHQDSQFYSIIQDRYDSANGTIHGRYRFP
jgi:hypothetical protein